MQTLVTVLAHFSVSSGEKVKSASSSSFFLSWLSLLCPPGSPFMSSIPAPPVMRTCHTTHCLTTAANHIAAHNAGSLHCQLTTANPTTSLECLRLMFVTVMCFTDGKLSHYHDVDKTFQSSIIWQQYECCPAHVALGIRLTSLVCQEWVVHE